MCGCNSGGRGIMKRDITVTFDKFYEIMSEKLIEARPNSNIIFESSKLL